MPDVVWPLSVAESHRHLQDASGRPFRANIDAAWFAPAEFWLADPESAASFDHYLENRRAKGFTGMLMMGMVQTGYNSYRNIEEGAYAHLPANRISGVQPLLVPDDFTTPNPEYWQNLRAIVARAGEYGIAVCLAYNYLGYPNTNEGWWKQLSGPANTLEGMRGFGTWLAELLADCKNIIWYPYGDMNPEPGEGSDRIRATIEAIRDARPGAIFAAELCSPDDVIGDNADADELLSVNSFYGFGPDSNGEVWRTADEAWRATPTRPCWTCEPQYDGAEIGGSGTTADVREAEWWSVLGGGTAGQVYGAVGVYNFARTAGPWGPDWRTRLDAAGARDAAHQFAFWADLPWWTFAPSGTDAGFLGTELITAGQDDGLRHIGAAGTPDGAWAAAYVPNRDERRTFSVDAGWAAAASTARWFDPTDGTWQNAAAEDGTFTTPGPNAAGDLDWVLVLGATAD